ncbi:WD40-repeat-containing domain protein [Amylostereum chailletii]|nr:WD40-repeat-containing domain protein [Amylostereum chailletii]
MSSIYAHRSLQPQGPQPPQQPGQARINDLLETIRQEFDGLSQELSLLRPQRDDFESKVSSQVNELNIIRQSLYDLESQHSKIRQTYEEEIGRLRAELNAARAQPSAHPTPLTQPPAYPDAFFSRRDDRERIVDRDRDRDRDRERVLERDRDRERDRERDRDRDRDGREPKRIKTDRIKTDRPEQPYSPYLPPVPAQGTSSSSLVPSSQAPLPKPSGPGLPPAPSFTPAPPPPSSSEQVPIGNGVGDINPNNSFLDDLDPHTAPPEYKTEGNDWFAVFNPKVKRVLNVQLVHTLTHESVVCCVRFSADGKYLATGCNRTAQIYDTATGAKTCVLTDTNAPKSGDLYIRSVCFSPDGKYLATGAEDKLIRIWDIAKRRIRTTFEGHAQEIYSLDFSRDGVLIVSGSGDRTARIWNMIDGTHKVLPIHEPETIDSGVTSVAISPDARLVAAGSLDTIVRIWDVATGNLVERLRGHKDSVYSVAFTPDGKGLVSGSLDKTLKYWDVRSVGMKRDQMGGPMTPGKEEKNLCTMNFTGHKVRGGSVLR